MTARFCIAALTAALGLNACAEPFQKSALQDLNHASPSIDCPQTKLGETAEDCPWSGIVRELLKSGNASQAFPERLQALSPLLWEGMQADFSDRNALYVWGLSQNFEAAQKSAIVDQGIMRDLVQMAHLPPPQGPNGVVVHAGIQHSYGYLLSNLKTAFGFKRQRWVRGDLEAGFGLSNGLLGPEPEDGGFLRNVSYFLGRIAFRDEPGMQSRLERIESAPELKKFRFEGLNIKRVQETFQVDDSRIIRIHTDLVELPFKAVDPAMTHLLVYSVEDSSAPHPTLISGFPIAQDAFHALLIPSRFGEKVSIKPRYNVFIPEVTNQKPEWVGSRQLL